MTSSGGKADKGRKQQKKKPQHTLKEKRKLKDDKKNKTTTGLGAQQFGVGVGELLGVSGNHSES